MRERDDRGGVQMGKVKKGTGRKATDRQKKYLKEVLENPSKSRYKCAIEAGYSPNTAQDPAGNIENQPSFQALLDKYVKEDDVLEVLKGGLKATKFQNEDKILTEVPDWVARKYYVDMSFRLRGNYAKDKSDIDTNKKHQELIDSIFGEEEA